MTTVKRKLTKEDMDKYPHLFTEFNANVGDEVDLPEEELRASGDPTYQRFFNPIEDEDDQADSGLVVLFM